MKIKYERLFLKDIKNIDSNLSLKIKKIIGEINKINNIFDISGIKKIVGFKNYYRIRIGDYRLGIKIENNICIFIRLKHRKDIYKIFP